MAIASDRGSVGFFFLGGGEAVADTATGLTPPLVSRYSKRVGGSWIWLEAGEGGVSGLGFVF